MWPPGCEKIFFWVTSNAFSQLLGEAETDRLQKHVALVLTLVPINAMVLRTKALDKVSYGCLHKRVVIGLGRRRPEPAQGAGVNPCLPFRWATD